MEKNYIQNLSWQSTVFFFAPLETKTLYNLSLFALSCNAANSETAAANHEGSMDLYQRSQTQASMRCANQLGGKVTGVEKAGETSEAPANA